MDVNIPMDILLILLGYNNMSTYPRIRKLLLPERLIPNVPKGFNLLRRGYGFQG